MEESNKRLERLITKIGKLRNNIHMDDNVESLDDKIKNVVTEYTQEEIQGEATRLKAIDDQYANWEEVVEEIGEGLQHLPTDIGNKLHDLVVIYGLKKYGEGLKIGYDKGVQAGLSGDKLI